MTFPWIVALRFLREGRMQTVLIVGGVAVGVAVMIFLSALMTGLQADLIDKTLGAQAQVRIRMPDDAARPLVERREQAVTSRVEQPPQRLRGIASWPRVLEQATRLPEVVAATPTVTGAGFASRGKADQPIMLRGIETSSFDRIYRVASRMVRGDYRVSGIETVIGKQLAESLGVAPGDKIRLGNAQGQGAVYTIAGVFDLQNQMVNEAWVLVSLRNAQSLLGLSGEVTAVELTLRDVFQANAVADELEQRIPLHAESWMRTNSQLLVALRSQDSSSGLIQFFVIIAVALGIASVLVVSVVQKSKEIGILKAMGARTGSITRVFLLQGFMVGLVGSVFGIGIGIGLSALFASFAGGDGGAGFSIVVTWPLMLRAALIACVIGVSAAVWPARRAARLEPAEVIRNG